MHTAAVARYLDGLGLVAFDRDDGTATCFLEQAPATPVDAVTIISQPGPEADGMHGYDSPGFAVVTRRSPANGLARPGYTDACAIRDALHGLHNVTLAEGTEDETRFISVFAVTSSPVSLGRDDGGNHRWSVGYRSEIRHVTALRA